MKKLNYLLLAIAFFNFLGCAANRYTVKVNNFNNRVVEYSVNDLKTIPIYLAPNEGQQNQLFDMEMIDKLAYLLKLNGFQTTANENEAQYYLLHDYGIGQIRTQLTTYPYYGIGYGTGFGRSDLFFDWTISHHPYYQEALYNNWLLLSLVDAKQYRSAKDKLKVKPLWYSEVTTESSKSDLRSTIDYLLVGATDHFGEVASKSKKIKITKDSKNLKLLKQTF